MRPHSVFYTMFLEVVIPTQTDPVMFNMNHIFMMTAPKDHKHIILQFTSDVPAPWNTANGVLLFRSNEERHQFLRDFRRSDQHVVSHEGGFYPKLMDLS
jgi:hypothetical protein